MSLIARIEERAQGRTPRARRGSPRRAEPRPELAAGRQKELQRELSDDEELQVLQRERKRRVEAAEAFRAAGREEQADDEEYELEILEEFMPEPMSEEEIVEIIDDVISEVGATNIRDMGRVMAGVMHQVSGRADGSTVSQLVKEKLRLHASSGLALLRTMQQVLDVSNEVAAELAGVEDGVLDALRERLQCTIALRATA